MKRTFSIYFAVLFILVLNSATAQINRPTTSFGPSGGSSGITFPLPYNTAGSPAFYNYLQTWVPTKPLSDTSVTTFHFNSANSIAVNTSYIDGFGQPIMNIFHSKTGGKDILTPVDNRPYHTQTAFLPYAVARNSQFQMDPFDDQSTYYLGIYPNEGGTSYSQTVIPDDQSTLKSYSYAPGQSFIGHSVGITNTITCNDTTTLITKYFINNSTGNVDGFGTYYSNNSLTVKSGIGQHSNMVLEYYNKSDQLVCKKQYAGIDKHSANIWNTTYYVYNDQGKICYTLPPAVSAANPTSGTFPSYIPLCFKYKYDKYSNLIESDLPGQNGATYYVFDNKFKPVLVQTPFMRAESKWEFVIYDSRNREVMKGLLTDTNSNNTWQGWANGTVTPSGGVVTGSLLDFILNGFTGTYPSSITNCEIQTISYYDNYGWDAAFSSNTFGNIDNSDFFTDATSVTPVPYTFTYGMLTAKKIKVIDPTSSLPNQWMTNVYFYDQKGNVIQVQTRNPWNTTTWDTTTMQYNFLGKEIFEVAHHYGWTGSHKINTKISNKYFYDDYYGRLSQVQQKADSGNWRIIQTPAYDDLGRAKSKNLGGIEEQDYEYNIRGQLQSINSDYVADPLIPDKTFGCLLSYDYGFDSVRFDGGLAGIKWRGAGTNAAFRAYGYKYDPATRLNYADFNQYNSSTSSWDHITKDFSMSNVTYDVNGNILTMNQRGTTLSGPVNMDVLTYTYGSNPNQLQRVQDTVSVNHGLGDFQDRTATTDYTYDADGNQTSDFNKQITSTTYNELDLPLHVQFANGSITNIYDATGNLLQKKVVDSSGASPHTDVYRYWGAFNYRNDSLLFVSNSAGRARWLPDSSIFKYDYYVKDHLGNVRTLVTSDETSPIGYFAGHELASAALESSIFANLDSVRDLKPGSTNPYDVQAAHLDGSDAQKRIGTALLMSVMAGDKFDISATSYFDTNSVGMTTYADGSSMLGAIIGSLVSGVGGYVGEGNNTSVVNSMFTTPNYLDIYEGILDSLTDYTRPRAFINYLVFDNSMNLVPGESGAVQISGTPGSWQVIGTSTPVTVGQNGYVSIYMSDEQYMPVFMDKLNIVHYQGRLIQEQHYYPFGLAINEGTSTTTAPTKNLFETNEAHTELGLDLSNFNFRQYDYQLGRFTSVDPLADDNSQDMMSPYHFVGNNPANYTDPSGLVRHAPPPGGSTSGHTIITLYPYYPADQPFLGQMGWFIYSWVYNPAYPASSAGPNQGYADYDGTSSSNMESGSGATGGSSGGGGNGSNTNGGNTDPNEGSIYLGAEPGDGGGGGGGDDFPNKGTKMNLPPFVTLWDNFPRNPDGSKARVPGNNAANQCSIRMSFDFVHSGVPIPRNLTHNDGYIYTARGFALFMLNNYGPPVSGSFETKVPGAKGLKGLTVNEFHDQHYDQQTGIIFWEGAFGPDVTGHVDLWNGTKSLGVYGTDYSGSGRALDTKIWFWPLK